MPKRIQRKLTERDVLTLERIKEKIQRHKSEIKDAQRALRRIDKEDFTDSPIDLGIELCPEVIVDDLDLFVEDLQSAIEQIDAAIEEYDEE